ncbi:zinc ribbon domain-containing protein [Actinoplanes sp. NPDC023936]|uniref:zinc-ribbon domain-containing protein n=1 Tax=Actinoplanes sp. NPDC023936 TaxID=3154910 RepID=UPI00340E1F3E
MIVCSRCARENADEARYCPDCGDQLRGADAGWKPGRSSRPCAAGSTVTRS